MGGGVKSSTDYSLKVVGQFEQITDEMLDVISSKLRSLTLI